MKIAYNLAFEHLRQEYNLPGNLCFEVSLPAEVNAILEDQIVITALGITLSCFGGLYKATAPGEAQSIVEDNENHFHVDSYAKPLSNKNVFMLGVKTLLLLAGKFEKEGITGVCFSYSFQTPKLGRLQSQKHRLHQKGDTYYVSDRLSFYTLRKGAGLTPKELFENPFYAMLLIDI